MKKLAASSQGAPPAGAGSAQTGPAESSLNMRVVFRLGRRYLGKCKMLVVLYVAGFLLCQTFIPLLVAVNAGSLTDYVKEHNASTSTKGSRQSEALAPEQLSQKSVMTRQPESRRKDVENRHPALPITSNRQLVTTYSFWVAFTILLIAAIFGHRYVTALLAGRVTNALRKDLFLRLLEQPSQFFHEHDADQLTLIVNQFCTQVQMALRSLLVDPGLNLIGMVTVGWTLYYKLVSGAEESGSQIWIFFVIIVFFALLSPWIVTRMGGTLQRSSRQLQQQMLVIQSLVGGAMKAPEEIQAMRAEAIFDRKHGTALDQFLQRSMRQTVTVEAINVANRIPGDLVLISLLGLAVFVAISGVTAISSGVIIVLFMLTPQFMGAIQGLSAFAITASMNWPAVDAVNSMLEASAVREETSDDGEVQQLEATLEARNLTFYYPGAPSRRILDNVSFIVPERRVSGFIAKAGQGKTTFFRLALRFYESQEGQILLGGRPHTSIPLNALRQQIVLMHQSPAFFHDTIRENFLIANPDATDQQIRVLCEKTPLWSILENSYGSDPLDRPFGAGNFLSGGEKKLFALTRCLLRNPGILLLDEPTTGIDSEEKFELVAMMRDACAGRTVLVVDHDIVGWQVLFCDYFFVLDHGKIVQQGTPGELLSQPGLFKDLFDKQAEGCHKMFNLIKQIEAGRRAEAASIARGPI
jgi:ABC-type multidrug transport system fused ATPase/permease subunit